MKISNIMKLLLGLCALVAVTTSGDAVLNPDQSGVCAKNETYTDVINITYYIPTVLQLGPSTYDETLTGFKSEVHQKEVISTRIVYECCVGYKEAVNGTECVLECNIFCASGVCGAPNVCTCLPGLTDGNCVDIVSDMNEVNDTEFHIYLDSDELIEISVSVAVELIFVIVVFVLMVKLCKQRIELKRLRMHQLRKVIQDLNRRYHRALREERCSRIIQRHSMNESCEDVYENLPEVRRGGSGLSLTTSANVTSTFSPAAGSHNQTSATGRQEVIELNCVRSASENNLAKQETENRFNRNGPQTNASASCERALPPRPSRSASMLHSKILRKKSLMSIPVKCPKIPQAHPAIRPTMNPRSVCLTIQEEDDIGIQII